MWTFIISILALTSIREVMAFSILKNARPFGIKHVKNHGRVQYASPPSSPTYVKSPPSKTRIFVSPLLKSFHTSPERIQNIAINSPKEDRSIAHTPLGSSSASHLLNGLDVYEVRAQDDHPLSVYGINSKINDDDTDESTTKRRPILLLHGRTWSAVPVYHLLGGENGLEDGEKSRSLMEAMYSAGLQPYCMDFRGFGGTPMDGTMSVIPYQCVQDVESAMEFIASRHVINCPIDEDEPTTNNLPALLGWSQGALVAQLAAQKKPEMVSKLILYGSIYDPMINYPRSPLYRHKQVYDNPDIEEDNSSKMRDNTFNSAIEDFTVEGSIPPEPAILFAEAALLADPIKAEWKFLSQFNTLDPARVNVPTLVVAGDQDPYAPLRVQADLYTNLAPGVDRTWSIIADADHAVHLLDGRERFTNIVKSFVENSKQGESDGCGLLR